MSVSSQEEVDSNILAVRFFGGISVVSGLKNHECVTVNANLNGPPALLCHIAPLCNIGKC